MAGRSGRPPPKRNRPAGTGRRIVKAADVKNSPRDNQSCQQPQGVRAWKSALSPVRRADGSRGYRRSWSWRSWTVIPVGDGWYRVVHQPSGITEFDSIAIARRFCERIDPLADWSVPDPSADPALGTQLHLAACAVTGSKPGLVAIKGGAP